MYASFATLHVAKCSACGRDHDVEFSYTDKPMVINKQVYHLVGVCPIARIALYARIDVSEGYKLDCTDERSCKILGGE